MSTLTNEEFAIADRIEAVLENDCRGLTPSSVARGARTTTVVATRILRWMVENRMAHTSGNGAWTRYYVGRA